MKKIKIILLLVIFCVFFVTLMGLFSKKTSFQISRFNQSPSPQLPTPTPIAISFAQQSLHIYIQPVTSENKVKLIPNFDKKEIASSLAKANDCISAINGGFYTSAQTSLGIFYTNGEFINDNVHSSQTLSAFVYQTLAGELAINPMLPVAGTYKFLFQSGPIFTPQSKLAIQNDEPARRILLGQTAAHQFLFIALTESNNTNSGPFLADLPEIFKRYNNSLTDSNQELTTLVNLDGGSASVFINPDFHLNEITPVGSLLCQT